MKNIIYILIFVLLNACFSYSQDSTKVKVYKPNKYSLGINITSPIENTKQFYFKFTGMKMSRFDIDFTYMLGMNMDNKFIKDTMTSTNLFGMGVGLNYDLKTNKKFGVEFGYKFDILFIGHSKNWIGKRLDRASVLNHSVSASIFLNLYKNARLGITTSYQYSTKTNYKVLENKNYKGIQVGITFQRNF